MSAASTLNRLRPMLQTWRGAGPRRRSRWDWCWRWGRRWRQAAGPLLLYGFLAVVVLSPLPPDSLPASAGDDLANHMAGIIEAGNALDQGQFPLRVAPNQHGGAGYPFFQYYGNLPYTAGAVLCRVYGLGPYAAYKATLFLSLVLGGLFTYRCARRLTRQRLPALAAGAVFLTAPYMLVDVHARFAFTEVVSFNLLPAALWAALRCFARRGPVPVLAGGLAWSALALSHNVTFFYGSLFVAAYVLSCAAPGRRAAGRLARVAAAYALGLALSAWYLVPQLLTLPFLDVTAHSSQGMPSRYLWLTPLGALLAPGPLLPTTYPAPLDNPRFGLQVGWPVLAAAVLAACYRRRAGPAAGPAGRAVPRLLALFAVAFLLVWGPVDFWPYLPAPFHYVQYSYRLLMFTTLWGALLAACALALAFRGRMRFEHLLACVGGLGALAAPALVAHPPARTYSEAGELSRPNVGRCGANQNFLPQHMPQAARTLLPYGPNYAHPAHGLAAPDWLDYPGALRLPPPRAGDVLCLEGDVPAAHGGPLRLSARLGGADLGEHLLGPGPFRLTLPLPAVGGDDYCELALRADRYLDPARLAPAAPGPGTVALHLRRATLLPAGTVGPDVLTLPSPAPAPGPGAEARFEVHAPAVAVVALPVLFYPGLLRVQDNGRDVPCYSRHGQVALVLPPGPHALSVRFAGTPWANWLSLAGWAGAGAGLGLALARRLWGRLRRAAAASP